MATRILVVCTGNICRSPAGEVILDARLRARGVPARVTSAGTAGLYRSPAVPEIVDALASLGLDGSAHRSRPLDARELAEADLVVAMTREHAREVVALEPDAWPRTFTLHELVRRGSLAGPRGHETLAAWLARLHVGRQAADLLGRAPHDDVADPYGRAFVAMERTVHEIESAIDRVVDLAWPAGSASA